MKASGIATGCLIALIVIAVASYVVAYIILPLLSMM